MKCVCVWCVCVCVGVLVCLCSGCMLVFISAVYVVLNRSVCVGTGGLCSPGCVV